MTNYILGLPHDSQLANLVSRLAELIGNMLPITDREVKEYIRRIVTAMNAEQVRDCIERELAYVRKIKQKITMLANAHAQKAFTDLLDVDRIAVQSTSRCPSRSRRAPTRRPCRKACTSPKRRWAISSAG